MSTTPKDPNNRQPKPQDGPPFPPYYPQQPPVQQGWHQQAPPFAPQPGMAPPGWQPPKRKHTVRNVILISVVSLAGLGIIGGALNSGSTAKPAADAAIPPPSSSAPAPRPSAEPTPTPEAKPTPPPAPKPAPKPAPETPAPAEKPKLSVSQEQAIESAESYLDSGDFSKKGLINQLKFEQFTTKEATSAVDHIEVNWTAEADASAAHYLETGSFSHATLMNQLLFEGYTKAQAAHGVKSVGL